MLWGRSTVKRESGDLLAPRRQARKEKISSYLFELGGLCAFARDIPIFDSLAKRQI
jgi:hypothetical protein